MTAVDYAIVDKASLLPSYLVACFHCHEHFIASAAAWCRCELRLATLVCPHCSGCFCRASESYKRRFWSEAPRSLRENSRRFRVEDRPGLNASPAALGTKSQQPWVLIVDDEEHMRSLVACYVEQMGYDVTTVSNAEEALAILETMAFDVVITDALMPRMDGYRLCYEVRHDPRRALDGGADGLSCYRVIAGQAPKLLKPTGHLVVELGISQEAAVAALFRSAGLVSAPAHPDLSGIPRALHARMLPQ